MHTKKISSLCLILLFGVVTCTFAQTEKAQPEKKKIATATIKTLDGKSFSTDSLSNNGKPMIISFWATWCKPCVSELTTINDEYADWQKETGVKLVAVSIDDARTVNTVAPFVNGKNWNYEVYLDANSDFRRAMNVNMVPHTFLVNGKGEIVSQHTSFAPGDEDKLFEMIQKVAKGEPLN